MNPLQGVPARRAALATPISRFERLMNESPRLCRGMVTVPPASFYLSMQLLFTDKGKKKMERFLKLWKSNDQKSVQWNRSEFPSFDEVDTNNNSVISLEDAKANQVFVEAATKAKFSSISDQAVDSFFRKAHINYYKVKLYKWPLTKVREAYIKCINKLYRWPLTKKKYDNMLK